MKSLQNKILYWFVLIFFIPAILWGATKISELSDEPNPTTDDYLVIVDDPGGTPATKRTDIGDLADIFLLNTGDTFTGTLFGGTYSGVNVTSGENPGHTHTTTSISGLVDADMANDALDPDKLVGDSGDDDLVDDALLTASITRDTEWDTIAEINSASTDDDAVTLTGAETLTNKTIQDTSNEVYSMAGIIKVFNNTGSTLNKGDAVYLSGYNAGQDAAEVTLADADDVAKMPALGIVEADISNGSLGIVVSAGKVSGFDTSSWSVGDVLYISTTAGALTNTKPSAGFVQVIAQVTRSHASLGNVAVWINAYGHSALTDHGDYGGLSDDDHPQYILNTGDTVAGRLFTQDLTITNLDCSGNANGGALTADASGNVTCSDDDGGGGSGDAVTVNSTAVDTTANFLDNATIEFDVADGGAGGPDDITGTLATDSVDIYALDDVDAPADGEILSYQASTGRLEWVADSGGSGDVTDVGDCATGACFTGASGTTLSSNTDIIIDLDEDNNGTETFQILDGADALVVEVSEAGVVSALAGFDCIGAVDCDFGSGDVTDFLFVTDGSGDGEFEIPANSINGDEIVDGGVDISTDTNLVGGDGILLTGDSLSVDNLTAGSDGDSALNQSDSGLHIVSGKLTLLRGCDDNQILKWDETQDDWNCEADGGGGGSSGYVILEPGSAFITGTLATVGDATQGAGIDGSNGGVLLFDASTDEGAAWRVRLPDNWASHTDVKIMYSMASGTANEVEFEAAVMCQSGGDSERDDADSFSTIAVASDTVPASIFNPDTVTITLNDDASPGACAASDLMTLFISTDADDATNDDATGDRRVLGVVYEYGT